MSLLLERSMVFIQPSLSALFCSFLLGLPLTVGVEQSGLSW